MMTKEYIGHCNECRNYKMYLYDNNRIIDGSSYKLYICDECGNEDLDLNWDDESTNGNIIIKKYLKFINNDFKKRFNFKSLEIEQELADRINEITSFLKGKSIYKINHDDLLFYERGIETMSSYYGTRWTSEVYFPFLQKYNPNTLLIIELITLFYSKSIYEMVSSDIQVINQLEKDGELFFDRITEKENKLYFDKCTMKFLLKTNNSKEPYSKVSSLNYYISILNELFVNQPTTRELTIYGEEDTFYISSDMYRNITDKLLADSEDERYKEIVQKIIGIYTLYFNKIKYFTEVQPLFLKLVYDSLLNIEDLMMFNNEYMEDPNTG